MDAQHENWDDLRLFLAVARAGSLSGAARALGVNHSTVFRRIGAFEAAIGVGLFDRMPNGYVLTAAGEKMRDSALRVEVPLSEPQPVRGRRGASGDTVRPPFIRAMIGFLSTLGGWSPASATDLWLDPALLLANRKAALAETHSRPPWPCSSAIYIECHGGPPYILIDSLGECTDRQLG